MKIEIRPLHEIFPSEVEEEKLWLINFARVVESAIPFFERNGYQSVGAMKQGKALRTQVMIKASLIPLAGRVARLF